MIGKPNIRTLRINVLDVNAVGTAYLQFAGYFLPAGQAILDFSAGGTAECP